MRVPHPCDHGVFGLVLRLCWALGCADHHQWGRKGTIGVVSRGSWDDDTRRLDERRADAPEVPRQRGRRKNTRRWCKGKPGVEHTTTVRLDPRRLTRYRSQCGVLSWWPHRWWCYHQLVCEKCGKILRYSIPEDCPTRPKKSHQKKV